MITPDDTGLWLVGAAMLAGGVVIGVVVVGSSSDLLWSRLGRRAVRDGVPR